MAQGPWEEFKPSAEANGPWKEFQASAPAGTLAYKQETARQQFEANRPESTIASRTLAAGEGVAGGLKDMLLGAVDFAKKVGSMDSTQQADALASIPIGIYHALLNAPAAYIDALQKGDYDEAARQAGRISTTTLPTAYGVVSGARAAVKGVSGDYIPQRLNSSLLKPDKASFDFGADPVKAFTDAGVWGKNLASTSKNLDLALNETETQLRSVTRQASGTNDVIDAFTDGIAEAKRQAQLDAKPQLARQLDAMATNRLMEIRKQYGTTDLTADQILDVKRDLGKGVSFSEDPIQQSLNTAKMSIYQKLDHQMDSLTGNASRSINQQYAGLIEAQRLFDTRLRQSMNSNLLPSRNIWELPIALVEKMIPSTLLKTGGAQLLK